MFNVPHALAPGNPHSVFYMSLVFVFLCLTDFTQDNVLSLCSCFCKWQNLFSKWMNNPHVYISNG